MRHQPRDAAVAVEERVNPQQAVMRGGGGEDCVGLAGMRVDALEAREEARQRAGADRDMLADLDVARAQLAGDDALALPCRGLSTQRRSSGSSSQKRR